LSINPQEQKSANVIFMLLILVFQGLQETLFLGSNWRNIVNKSGYGKINKSDLSVTIAGVLRTAEQIQYFVLCLKLEKYFH